MIERRGGCPPHLDPTMSDQSDRISSISASIEMHCEITNCGHIITIITSYLETGDSYVQTVLLKEDSGEETRVAVVTLSHQESLLKTLDLLVDKATKAFVRSVLCAMV